MSVAELVLLALAALLLAEQAWKHLMVIRFFRRPLPRAASEPRLVSVLQPILSGDPTLPACLEHNLRLRCRYPLEFLWLVDTDDPEGEKICRELAARHPEANVRLVLLPPPAERSSPKTFKLVQGIPLASGDVLCVLDDDTMLPEGGLEQCLPHLDRSGVGLAFGLPYYTHFANFWSSLVSYYGNSHSLLTYVPYTSWIEPVTINGMFYCFRRTIYEAIGGFAELDSILADDFAVARRFRDRGYRLAQTSLRHPIKVHVESWRAYLRILHRWLVFPQETVLKSLPARDLAIVYLLGALPVLGPLLLLCGLALAPSWWLGGALAAYLAYHYLIFAHFNLAYLERASPWRGSWQVVLIQVLLAVQLLAASLAPQRIHWRGHLIAVEKGGSFRFLKRRG